MKYKLILLLILLSAGFFRLWKLDRVPVSLFSDELDVGYQAYSLIKTGRDYSGNFIPLFFESYADMRAPLYIYLSIPSVYLFGITPYGVRLPAAVFGILGVWAFYLMLREISGHMDKKVDRNMLALLGAGMLAISPWHIQYSRAAFEVTVLLFFLIIGIYFFLKSLNNPKFLILSSLSLGLTPWTYSTAKFFIPVLIIFLLYIWRREIFKYKIKNLIPAVSVLILLFFPLIPATFSGQSSQRFSYISIFTDPTTEPDISYSRLFDTQVRQSMGGSFVSKALSRMVHNKFVVWATRIKDNYFKAISSEFLFMEGDINLRHSPNGIGQFYTIEIIALFIGIYFIFFSKDTDRKIKVLIAFLIIFGILPAAITRDGGMHATRLITILPGLLLIMAYGIIKFPKTVTKNAGTLFLILYFLFLSKEFIFYQHIYWVHNPWYSERSWHAGYKQMISAVKDYQYDYNRIIITNAEDQPYIFFAAYYPYPPDMWQKGFAESDIEGFGKLVHADKFFFGQVGETGLKGLPKYLDEKTLYIAAQREWEGNLIKDPQKRPKGLRLLRSVSYPSGEPAFYFFTKGDLSEIDDTEI